MEKRPKTANNAAIQQSFYCICSRNGVKYEILSEQLQINAAPVKPNDIPYQNFLPG